jgi:hypothetical protein
MNMKPQSHFTTHRDAALAVLTYGAKLTRKAGQFLGQLCTDASPISEKQRGWLANLLQENDLPPLVN